MNAALHAVLKNPPINTKNQNTKVCFYCLHGSYAQIATIYHLYISLFKGFSKQQQHSISYFSSNYSL